MDIDFEGAEACLLTAMDTYELCQIMTQFAGHIWSNMQSKPSYSRLYEINPSGKYQWKNDKGLMQIGLDSSEKFIEIDYQGENPYKICVNQAVEIIQVLESYITA